jgi:hypothetical protein
VQSLVRRAQSGFDDPQPGFSHDRNVKLVLEKKEDIQKRLEHRQTTATPWR